MNIGFVGLGIMGTPMAGHLIKAGHRVFLYSIPSVPKPLEDAGDTDGVDGLEEIAGAYIGTDTLARAGERASRSSSRRRCWNR